MTDTIFTVVTPVAADTTFTCLSPPVAAPETDLMVCLPDGRCFRRRRGRWHRLPPSTSISE